jgi:hypothetical protein
MEGLNDLRRHCTGIRLKHAERMEAQLRHIAAVNDAQLAEKKALKERRGLKSCTIGSVHLPDAIVRIFSYINVGSLR